MSSKREEERNEKVIRGLMKLPPNRRCINCNSLVRFLCLPFVFHVLGWVFPKSLSLDKLFPLKGLVFDVCEEKELCQNS